MMAYAVSLVACVHDEAANCTSLRPHSTLSSNCSARGPGDAIGFVIYMVQFCHQNVSEPPLTQRDVVLLVPSLNHLLHLMVAVACTTLLHETCSHTRSDCFF